MNVNNKYGNEIKNVFLKTKTEATQNEQTQKYKYSGEYDSISKSLKLTVDEAGWLDAQKTYIVNKDGSGLYITSWGHKKYPPETFSDVLKYSEEMLEKNSRILTDENTKTLIKCISEKMSQID